MTAQTGRKRRLLSTSCMNAATVLLLASLHEASALTRVELRTNGPVTAETLIASARARVGYRGEGGRAPSLRGAKRDLLGREVLRNFDRATFLGEIKVGSKGQAFTVVFDTGSSDTWLPASTCQASCLTKRRFDHTQSASFVASEEPFHVIYGSGSVDGVWGKDDVWFGNMSLKGQRFAQVTDASGLLPVYSSQPFDGVVGLAFDSLSSGGGQGVLTSLTSQGAISRGLFGVSLSLSDTEGSLTFGETDPSLYEGELAWVPLSEAKYWSVRLEAVGVGGQDFKSTSEAIVDSGTTLLVGPEADVSRLMSAIGARYEPLVGVYSIKCDATPPPIAFTVANHTLEIQARDYIVPGQGMCVVGVAGLTHLKQWILGDVFLSTFYTCFDADNKRLGFAPRRPTGSPAATAVSP